MIKRFYVDLFYREFYIYICLSMYVYVCTFVLCVFIRVKSESKKRKIWINEEDINLSFL